MMWEYFSVCALLISWTEIAHEMNEIEIWGSVKLHDIGENKFVRVFLIDSPSAIQTTFILSCTEFDFFAKINFSFLKVNFPSSEEVFQWRIVRQKEESKNEKRIFRMALSKSRLQTRKGFPFAIHVTKKKKYRFGG